jgi:hypothetical protein
MTLVSGEPTELKFRKRKGKLVLFSADLSAATDNLSQWAIRSVCGALKIPYDLVSGGDIDGHPIRRGTLMGIPLSWVVLSLVHAWACAEMGIPEGSFHLKGDDLVGLWTQEEIDTYSTQLVVMTGMDLNPSKCICDAGFAVFCERMFVRTSRNTCALMGTVPLRMLEPDKSQGQYPWQITLGDNLWSLRGRVPWEKIYYLYKQVVVPSLPIYRKSTGPLPPKWGGISSIPADPEKALVPWVGALVGRMIDGKADELLRTLRYLHLKRRKDSIGNRIVKATVATEMQYHVSYTYQFVPEYDIDELIREVHGTYANYYHGVTNLPLDGGSSYVSFARALRETLKKEVKVGRSRVQVQTCAGARDLSNQMLATLPPQALQLLPEYTPRRDLKTLTERQRRIWDNQVRR